MSLTVVASNGQSIPVADLEMSFTYDGENLETATIEYAGITYIKTFTYAGALLTNASQWIAQP